jgi:hypothetical protein
MMGTVRFSFAMLRFALILDFPHSCTWAAVGLTGPPR